MFPLVSTRTSLREWELSLTSVSPFAKMARVNGGQLAPGQSFVSLRVAPPANLRSERRKDAPALLGEVAAKALLAQ